MGNFLHEFVGILKTLTALQLRIANSDSRAYSFEFVPFVKSLNRFFNYLIESLVTTILDFGSNQCFGVGCQCHAND